MFHFVMALSMLGQKKISEHDQNQLIADCTPLDRSERQIPAFFGLLEFGIIEKLALFRAASSPIVLRAMVDRFVAWILALPAICHSSDAWADI